MREPKTHSQRKHAKRRALERFGVTLNRHDMRTLVEGIQNNSAIFLEHQTNRTSLFVVKLVDKWVRAVYDKHRQTIVTFLPHEVT